jgi:predicted DNA-binding protein (UPF0251 family)
MPRPKRCRFIEKSPGVLFFKPAGIPGRDLEIIELELDEFEAIRLADKGKLYQEEAALKMGVSRQTFGRIIESAHQKIAEAITEGKGLRINNQGEE